MDKKVVTLCCVRNVYLFPNGLHQNGIPGYLSIIEDKEPCITWAPADQEKRGMYDNPHQNVYSMRIPLDDVLSIRQCFPKFGQPSIVITVKEGQSFNPFYFYEGGVPDIIRIIRQLLPFAPTESDPNLFVKVEHVLSVGNLPPPPSEVHPDQTPYSPTHQRQNFKQQAANLQNSGWGFFNNVVKQFAKDASTIWYDEYRSSPPPKQETNLDIDDFEIVGDHLDIDRVKLADETVRKQPLGEPLASHEWINCFDDKGRVNNVDFLKQKIYFGGMEPSLRPEVWKYLLGYYPFDSTFQEREIIKQQKNVEYQIYQSQWESITEEQESHFSKFRSLKERIEKDVVRTDRTWQIYESDDSPQLREIYRILLSYSFFNFDIGYVQGMNDLVSILLVVMQNEVDAFWCFKGFMDRVMDNFDKNQVGMHTQLTQLSEILKYMDYELYKHLLEVGGTNMFFCFKWLLIVFKREFPLDHVQRIWEVIWSDHYSSHHQLFICLAMLLNTKKDIIGQCLEFDEILRHLNSTAKTMDYEKVLIDADWLYRKFITICDTKTQNEIFAKKGPPPPIKSRRDSD